MVEERMYDDIKVGDKAEYSKTITEGDVFVFAGLSGDYNPIHLDDNFAKNTMFGQRIAHGMFSACLISTIFGTIMPGMNTIYLSQDLRFKKPVFLGDTVTAVAEVMAKDDSKRTIEMKTTVYNQKGEEVIEGKARVMKKD